MDREGPDQNRTLSRTDNPSGKMVNDIELFGHSNNDNVGRSLNDAI